MNPLLVALLVFVLVYAAIALTAAFRRRGHTRDPADSNADPDYERGGDYAQGGGGGLTPRRPERPGS